MAYTALYRKFRPSEFNDVKGQEHIVTTLKNQVNAGRIGHAYLFCGTRGTGKTTIAKILAKAVNCENPVEGSPCNECSMCKSINGQTSMNVIEIDAASNNGVDNIREIIDEVQYSPTEGRYKVYIIDEVHMLSAGAFNALLKTLEEPPAYVIFILATTEAHKIPITILSRCQRYDFKRITIDTISARLLELMEKESIEVEDKAIRYIAKTADGSMRDALSLLDQCIAFYFGQKLTYDNVLEVLGAVDIEIFSRMLKNIINNNIISCIELLEELIIGGREIGQFVIDFTWYLRNLLLVKTSDQALDIIDISSDNVELLRQEATLIDVDTLMRYIRILSELSNQVKYATQKRVLVEIALIKLCKPAMETNYDSILNRLSQIEAKIEKGIPAVNNQENGTVPKEVIPEKEQELQAPIILPNAIPEDLKEVAKNWNSIVMNVSPVIRALLTSARPSINGDNTLLLVFNEEVDKDFIDNEERLREITNAIEKMIHKQVIVRTKLINQGQESMNDFPDLTKIIKMNIEYED
ncbi:DNA polymerase-3 subunit gamma/tau [Mobilisporobacter senegalensis]|uniref:DNA-directed DNA polymerase n=1 Tax=Mobilisporobacter senegalensis TaxID=1329262 RepID=A0A3N1XA79_9FIRM|nr:DNA polymerase III subunit gamma/tau [Mobilisporobacter senegalensis]ROR23625.1 DNA polymerase-3 subunit gamma/tau [Mobilisporobacter senegalensis]